MTAALVHRGPDGDGFHTEPGVGLGHRRLSIIDIAGGHQPMYNEDESVVIVFNGGNLQFPGAAAEARGARPRVPHRSDTEAIVHAWESWGPDCLQHLNGQFVIALWDRNQKTLFLARDRMGEKPLYYARRSDGSLVFGSELAALAQVRDLPRQICAAGGRRFLRARLRAGPAYDLRGHPQAAGGRITCCCGRGCHGGAAVVYWSAPTASRPIEEGEALQQLRARLSAATGQCLLSDVPLGAFLSGGRG